MLEATRAQWGGRSDLWVFAYASLIWRPEFEFAEQRRAHATGWHRALKMWSRVNRGTPECPGLVFALLPGGCCHGLVFRIPRRQGDEVLQRLWDREMFTAVYDPRWLPCRTELGPVQALGFTLSRKSPSYTGPLSDERMRAVFSESCGRFGTTLDYARSTHEALQAHGIRDRELARLLALAPKR